MLVFPQLASGAVSQMPFERVTAYRTLLNQAADGREVRVTDADFFQKSWQMPMQSLSDEEWEAVQSLFAAAEGQLQTFLFLEPGENLLSWSEDFTQPAWTASGVTIVAGVSDPLGGAAGAEISGSGSLAQSLNVPANFRYTASVWAKTTQPGGSLQLSDGAGQQASRAFLSEGEWRRYTLSTAFTGPSETLVFEVRTPGPGALDIFGAQLEAQPSASAYKKTFQQTGVHPAARFSMDTLSDTLTSPGQHSGVLRIQWTPSQT